MCTAGHHLLLADRPGLSCPVWGLRDEVFHQHTVTRFHDAMFEWYAYTDAVVQAAHWKPPVIPPQSKLEDSGGTAGVASNEHDAVAGPTGQPTGSRTTRENAEPTKATARKGADLESVSVVDVEQKAQGLREAAAGDAAAGKKSSAGAAAQSEGP
eukprot:SAG31_NODE_2267_length_6052_cov_7.222241_5_plen_155_part_00